MYGQEELGGCGAAWTSRQECVLHTFNMEVARLCIKPCKEIGEMDFNNIVNET